MGKEIRQFIRRCFWGAAFWTLSAGTVSAATYFVSPTGSDASSGTTIGTAWRTLNRSEILGIAAPGDTVNILPGTYAQATATEFTTSGTNSAPIVYRRFGRGQATIDLSVTGNQTITAKSSYVRIIGLTIVNANGNDPGIELIGDHNSVSECYIRDVDRFGIRIAGDSCLVTKNVIAFSGDDGIRVEGSGDFTQIYNNTLYEARNEGIELISRTARLVNNIVTLSSRGIKAAPGNIAAFNNAWGNVLNYDGITDSAGGISVPPQFVDPTAGRFDLQRSDAGIDAGLNVGIIYSGSAPDLGGIEKYNVYYVSPSGSDLNDGRTPQAAWQRVDEATAPLYPGDTVNLLAGVFADSAIVTSSGLLDDRIVFRGHGDSTQFAAAGRFRGLSIEGAHVLWSRVAVSGAVNANIYVTGDEVEVANCEISESATCGISIGAARHVKLSRNRFFGNEISDVLLGGDSAAVEQCTFYSVRYAIDALSSSYHTFINNVFLGAVGASAAVRAMASSTLSYSIVSGFGQQVQGGIALGPGCLTSDPQLVDAPGGNFHPASHSPAIDAGAAIGVSFVGSAPDMGAYETQPLVSLEITPNPTVVAADTTIQFDVMTLGGDGYPAAPGTLTWSHTLSSGSISSQGILTPQFVGTGRVQVQSSFGGISAMTGTFSVVPGSLSQLQVTAASYSLPADSSLQFALAGLDVRGNAAIVPGGAEWSVTGGIGSVDPAGLFSATRVGTGQVKASIAGVIGTSDTVTVVPGRAVIFEILPQSNIVQALQSYQYAAFTYDADSNLVSDVTSSTSWTVTDLGSISGSGLYTAGAVPGNYQVRGSWGALADTANVSVVLTGGLSQVRIEALNGSPANDTTLTADQDFNRFYARGYDGSGNLIGDVVVSWQLIGADSIGTISAGSAASTILNLRRTGIGRLVAVHASGHRDTTGIITCTAGVVASIQISPSADTISADITLQFSYVAYDADRNVTVFAGQPTWMTRGQIGVVSADGLFTPSLVGSGMVICSVSGIADTATPVVVVPGALHHIVVSPDQATLSADSTKQFIATGYDAKGNATSFGSITWSLTSPIGTLGAGGLYTPSVVGVTRVRAVSNLGPVDTSAAMTIIPGQLMQMSITPNSASITVDDHIDFLAAGADAHGNAVIPGTLFWRSLRGVGQVNSQGTYIPTATGFDSVIVTDTITGVADTTALIETRSGQLRHLAVVPHDTTLKLGEQIACSVHGYDALFNATATGSITWSVLGGIGTIDLAGHFTSTQSGYGQVVARSSINGLADTTDVYTVEALQVSAASIGTVVANPGASNVPVLVARLTNPFSRDKAVARVVLKYNNRGRGTSAQLLSNIASVSVYLDMDNSLSLTAPDLLLATQYPSSDSLTISLSNLAVPGNTERTLIAALAVSASAADADTLDLFLTPAGITVADATPVTGASVVNSAGHVIVDGLVAAQVRTVRMGRVDVFPSDSLVPVFCAALPRNGYAVDTLRSLRLQDVLQADAATFDSLVLFADNGNGTWGGRVEEQRLGTLVFTGADYSRTGLQLPLVNPYTTIYVAAALTRFPVHGTQFAFGIPVNGVDMRSGNDGPIDAAIAPADTITVLTAASLSVVSLPLSSRTIAPGTSGGPLLSMRLRNDVATATRLDSLAYQLEFTDPGGANPAQLLSQVESLYVYLERTPDYQHIETEDILLKAIGVNSATAWLDIPDVDLAPLGGSAILSFYARLNATSARNGNRLGLQIVSSGGIGTTGGPAIAGVFPVHTDSLALIDMFPASLVTVDSTANNQLRSGQLNQPVMSFALPRNGFAADNLRRIRLSNSGTLPDPNAISSLRLWRDLNGNGYSADDLPVGIFSYANAEWQLADITSPLDQPQTRFVVTASIANDQFDGGTLRLVILQSGITCWSGMSGPDDRSVVNPATHTILPPNRITVISVPASTDTVAPGERNRQLLAFALYNGYQGQTKTLTKLTFSNLTRSVQTAGERDAALGNIQLLHDATGTGMAQASTLIGSGSFVDGALSLNGLSVALAPETLSYFFALTDVPLSISDGDSLAIGINSAGNIGFSDAVILNGNLPLRSGGYLITDGSVKAQFTLLPVSGGTLQPGDSTSIVFAFRPARNGNLDDALTGLTITNQFEADSGDISELSLWHDVDADQNLSPADSKITILSFQRGSWTSSGLYLPVTRTSPLLFLVARVSSGASLNARLRLAISVNGCQMVSGNDGPRDSGLVCEQSFTLSNARLAVRDQTTRTAYTVGQSFDYSYSVINRQGNTVNGLAGLRSNIAASSPLRLDSSSTGPMSLAAGDSAVIVYHFTAVAPGRVTWEFQVGTPGGDSSAVIASHPIVVDAPASGVRVSLISTAPAAVSRGQANIFPLTIKCEHLDTALDVVPVRLDSFLLHVEDLSGAPAQANHIFSQMIISSGFENRHPIDPIPASSSFWYTLPSPLILGPGESRNLLLQIAIDTSASVDGFRFVLSDNTSLPFVDYNSGVPVTVISGTPYPLRTAICRINDPSPYLFVSSVSVVRQTVNQGQQNVPALRVFFRHAGSVQSSSVQLSSMTLTILDGAGRPQWPSDVVSGIRVSRGSFILGERASFAGDSVTASILLGSPLNLSPGQNDSVTISVDVKGSPGTAGFRLMVGDSSALQIRDLNTGDLLATLTDTSKLATGSAFPMVSEYARFVQRSVPPKVCVDLNLPPQVAAGADSVNLARFVVTNVGSVQQSPIRLDYVTITITDSTGRPIDIGRSFDRLGYRVGTSISHSVVIPPDAVQGTMRLPLADSGVVVGAGETLDIQVMGDIESSPAERHLVVQLSNEDFIAAVDNSDGTALGAATGSGCTYLFPLRSTVASIFAPAGRPGLSLNPNDVILTHAGAAGQELLRLNLSYMGSTLQSDVELERLHIGVLRRTATGMVGMPARQLCNRVVVVVDGLTVSTDSAAIGDSLRLALTNPHSLSAGTSVSVAVLADLRSDVPLGNYRLVLADSGSVVLRDRELRTTVFGDFGSASVPLYGIEFSVVADNLGESFSNYPNPFVPSRGQETTIGYSLESDGYVDIDLFTVSGELVRRVTSNAWKSAGAHNEDRWNGANGVGEMVVSGAYFCRITARYQTGKSESFMRKVAVIR